MATDPKEFLSQIFTMPYGDMIASVGHGVAEAQRALDEGSLAATLDLYESESLDDRQQILQAIGYQPQYYGLRNVKGHLKMAMGFQAEGSGSRLWATPINPVITGKYNYDAQASSELTFEIVPLPPAEQIRKLPDFTNMEVKAIRSEMDRLGLSLEFVDADGNSLEDNDAIDLYKYSDHTPKGPIVRIDQDIEFEVIDPDL